MKELLTFILENILPDKKLTIEEVSEGTRVDLKIVVASDMMGIIIGKGGKTIKAIQDVMRVKGRLEGKNVFVNVVEETTNTSFN